MWSSVLKNKFLRISFVILSLVLFVLIFTGCGKNVPVDSAFCFGFGTGSKTVTIYNNSKQKVDNLDVVLTIKGENFDSLTIRKKITNLAPHEERIISFKEDIPENYKITNSLVEIRNPTVWKWNQ